MTLNCELKRLRPEILARYGWSPKPKTAHSAGVDLIACIDETLTILPGDTVKIPTGVAVHIGRREIAAKLYPRSSLGHKGLVLGNLVGIVDGDYQGEIVLSLWNRNLDGAIVIQPGERVAQMVLVPVLHPDWREVETFSAETARGTGGFGSTGARG